MNEAYQTARVVRFGVFEADLRTAELRKQGVRIRLSGQSFQILEALLLRPGELVTREELKQKLWPSDSFGDFEHGLNAAVNRVREALGDSSENPRFVETLPRRGYRFIAPVEENSNGAGETPPLKSDWAASETQPAQDSNGSGTAGRSMPPWAIKLSLAVLAVLFLLSASGALLFMRYKNRQEQKAGQEIQEEVRITPLTTLPGAAMSPAFSPDGSQVVFAWDGGNSYALNPFDLYVKVIGSDDVEQLTHLPAQWIDTAWSPDGSTIAFVRKGGEKPGIFSISARGGPERKLADITFNHAKGGLSWSSDARQLLYFSGDGVDVLTLESGEIHPLDLPSKCKGGGYTPAFSPDGRWAAFPCTHYSTSLTSDLYLFSLKGDSARDLFRMKGLPDRLAWSTDSH